MNVEIASEISKTWLILILFLAASISPGLSATASGSRASQEHKAGIYLRVPPEMVSSSTKPNITQAMELLGANPNLDAVDIPAIWRNIEPEKGVYSFDSLKREVNYWSSKGKGGVVSVVLYGQGVDDRQTPPWLYKEKDVRSFWFNGGGTAKGRKIRLPAVWDETFVAKYMEPLVSKLAQELDGNKSVWYVKIGYGHIGNVTAQPSASGGPAFVENGFTPVAWAAYCDKTTAVYKKYFKSTPLILMTPGALLRNTQYGKLEKENSEIVASQCAQDVSAIHFGLEQNAGKVWKLVGRLQPMLQQASKGTIRFGLGDDWPLWVPEKRRDKAATRGLDDPTLENTLNNAFGGINGLPKLPTTILLVQLPEMLASSPGADEYHKPVADALSAARVRMKAIDAEIFAKDSVGQGPLSK